MNISGSLRKMRIEHIEHAPDQAVTYHMVMGAEEITLNSFLGKKLSLTWQKSISCVHCGRQTKKSFNQGFCYPCFKRLAQCDMCIMKPETCHYHAGSCREPEWGEAHCMQSHYVYLANSSGVKVGITRQNQIPTRWLDQGATQAFAMMRVSSRLHSGLVEVAMKEYVADKTSWQKMLKADAASVDLIAQAHSLKEKTQAALSALEQSHDLHVEWLDENDTKVDYIGTPVTITYPILEYPQKVKSFNFDKDPIVEGVLQGIKGQYLIFDTGVINIRKFGGYEVTLNVEEA